jgi:hypothetical protein
MSRVRLFAVSALAVFAVSALGASAAFANGEYHGFTGTAEIEGKGGESILESTIATAKVIIVCTTVKGTGTLTATTGVGGGELTYETCKLINTTAAHAEEVLTACTVANPVAKIAANLGAGNTLETLTPKETNFTEIKITGASCAAKGTFAVTGSIVCSGPRGFISKEVHILNCNSANSTLKLGAEAARLTGSLEVNLKSKAAWYGE